MDEQAVREQLNEVRESLTRNEEEHEILLSLLKGYEGWLRLHGMQNGHSSPPHYQIPLEQEGSGRGGQPKGAISFRQGVRQVYREARGEPLTQSEAWTRMQVLGVKSEAKSPIGLIGLTARTFETEIEKVDTRTWRWIKKDEEAEDEE